MDAAVDGNFTNNTVAPTIFTEVLSEKISKSSIQDLYVRVGMHLATYTVNTGTPQLADHGFYTVNVLNKGAGIWISATRVRRSMDVAHCSVLDHSVGESTAVGDSVISK